MTERFTGGKCGFPARERLRGFECNEKCFEAGQLGDESDDRFGK